MLEKYLAPIRDFLFIISLLTTAVFFISPDARRLFEKTTNRTISAHLGTYSIEEMNWVNCPENENPNFYHVSFTRERKLRPETINSLEGKIVIGEPKSTVPGRVWPPTEKRFSDQEIISNISSGTCYFVNKVKAVKIEKTENSACLSINGDRISYWLKLVPISCD